MGIQLNRLIVLPKNKWIDDLKWSSPAKQDRAERTIDALIDAAGRLFAENGAEATSIADIAREAGCSVGAVYHHFDDKNALLRALVNRKIEIYQTVGAAALDPARWEGASILDILRGFMELALNAERDHPGHKQVIYEAARNDKALQAHLAKLDAGIQDGLRDLLWSRKEEVRHPDPSLAIRFAIDQCFSIIRLRREKGAVQSQTEKRSDAKIIDQTMISIGAYLEIK